jgi:hypothetical protein
MWFAFNGRAIRNFLALLCMEFILFIDRVNLAAAAPAMQRDLRLGNIALGLAFSAFNYSYAPFQLVGGWIADRFGARRTLGVCGLAWSIMTMATGAVCGLGSLFAVRLVLGMGEVATLPAASVELDPARAAREGGRDRPFRRPSRCRSGSTNRRLPDHLVFLASLSLFALLAGKQIKRGIHRSVHELKAAIAAFIQAHNADPKAVHLDQDGRCHPPHHRAILLRHPRDPRPDLLNEPLIRDTSW